MISLLLSLLSSGIRGILLGNRVGFLSKKLGWQSEWSNQALPIHPVAEKQELEKVAWACLRSSLPGSVEILVLKCAYQSGPREQESWRAYPKHHFHRQSFSSWNPKELSHSKTMRDPPFRYASGNWGCSIQIGLSPLLWSYTTTHLPLCDTELVTGPLAFTYSHLFTQFFLVPTLLGTTLGAGDFMKNKTAKILTSVVYNPVGKVNINQVNKSV